MSVHPGREISAFAPVDADSFRTIMRQPVSSVAIVATGRSGRRAGCTVTAICSLSDAPPSLLVCLNARLAARHAIVSEGGFTVNYLSESQCEDADLLAGRLGMRGDEKFSNGRWHEGPQGLPYLRGVLAVLVCQLESIAEFGSHSILCGRI